MAYNVAYGEGGQLATQLAGETGTAANWQACKRICADEESGEFLLPLEMVQKVMSCLAQFEADGVRGPSMVACDLANAALVSKGFHKASKFGFSTLEEQTAQLQEVAELRDRLQQQLQELPQVVARMVKRHQELSQMSGKQLQGLLEEIGRQPKELPECQQKMDQTLSEVISMRQRLDEWVQQVNTNYNFTSIQEAENR
ncbi:hypothetical protein OEZ86_008101 [Tetradesmus obliquus]|nr:hypothetical protein OEZ86_008101 [Tetradesmus obliquus]